MLNEPYCFSCDGIGVDLPVLRMRGFCQNSQFDKNYVLAQNSEDILFFQGDRHTNITFNKNRDLWIIVSNRKTEGNMDFEIPVMGYSSVSLSELYIYILI